MDSGYVFIIETDKFAGNFNRKMCAYATGVLGASRGGEAEAREFYNHRGLAWPPEYGYPDPNPFCDIIAEIPDSECCHEPSAIWSPGNTNVGIFFSERPSNELMTLMQERIFVLARI